MVGGTYRYVYICTNMCLGELADKSSCPGKVARRLLDARCRAIVSPARYRSCPIGGGTLVGGRALGGVLL